MKRPRATLNEGSDGGSGSDNDAFDDGDDLMARAASMMDFDDEEDESDSDEDSEASTSEAGPSTGKKQKLNGGGHKGKRKDDSDALPDDEEAELQSVLQLKIDALLASVRCPDPSSSKAQPLNNFIQRISTALNNASPRPALPAQEAVSKLKSSLPFSDGTTNLKTVNWQFAFTRPSKVQVGGSWSTGSSCKWKGKQGWNVDVLIQIPGSLLREKDIKDNRYLYHRAYYLSVVKEVLEASETCETVQFTNLNGNQRKPILEIQPSNDVDLDFSKLRCSVRVIPVFEWSDAPFAPAKLGPSRGNLRSLTAPSGEALPTPIYNSDVASDGSCSPTTSYMDRIAKRSDSFAQAALLLKIWAHQRNLSQEYGLSHCLYLLSVLLAYVLDGTCKGVRTVPAGSGTWPAFKACLDSLVRTDFRNSKLVSFSLARQAKAPSIADWQAYAGPVLTDPTGMVNLLAETPFSALDLLRYEAKLTLRMLKRGDANGFEQVLLCKMDQPHLRFDQLARIDLPLPSTTPLASSDSSSSMSHLLSRLADVLKDGLNSRARALSICPNHQSEISTATVQIGLYLEPGQIQRLVEYGPAADIPEEVKKFRQLWGNKAETRKFRDGRILESVVWEAEGPEQRSKIFMQIIQHLLSHHFSLPKTSVHFFAPAYDKLLAESPQVRNARYSADPQITGFSPLTAAFDYLVKELKELKDLPLQITSVVPVSEDLRYSSTFVPGALRVKNLPHLSTAANHVTVHDCYITFETSGKWPEDLEAIQKIKGAFLARLAKTLSQAIPGTRCTVQYDLDSDPVTDHCCLIVTVPQGFVFRLRVHHERERSMMEDALLDDDQDETHKKRTQAALVRHHKTFTALPDHHGALSALQSKHPSYSTTVRITKRWLAAHCLANHLPTELIELVAAHVYLDAESPYEVPATGAMGFARVLDFLSQWKWRESPLLVPIYTAPTVHDVGIVTSFPDKQRQKAMSNFAALRKADPMLTRSAWFIATEKDTGGRAWGEQSPSKLVAGRVQELARACSQALSSAMTSGNPNVQHIFISDLDAFDFVLHLSPAMVSNHMQAVVPSSKDLAKRPDTPQTIRPGFNAAVSYLNRLESLSGDICIFFYDRNGGITIGGLFNPSLVGKERAFRIALDFPTAPSTSSQGQENDSKQNVHLDKKAFLDRLVTMSDGLVEKISIKVV